MKVITLEDGTRVEISDESYEALQKAVKKPNFVEVVKKRMPKSISPLRNWNTERFSWLENKQSQKEFEIYLHMLLWKETYDNDFEPDWGDGNQMKYYVFYSHYHKRWWWTYNYLNQQPMKVCVSSGEKAEQMFKDLQSIGVL